MERMVMPNAYAIEDDTGIPMSANPILTVPSYVSFITSSGDKIVVDATVDLNSVPQDKLNLVIDYLMKSKVQLHIRDSREIPLPLKEERAPFWRRFLGIT